MKRIALLFALFIAICFSALAQETYITATVTVTNCATNGDTFSVNGHQRTWTNLVTSAANQILLTNGGSGNAATNLFYAYITYPETSPYISVTMIGSNVLQFQTLPSSGPALVIATNGVAGVTNWVTWSYNTTTLTNAQVIRLPTNGIGNIERTNDQNWFVGLFDDLGATNSFYYGAPMFRQFLGTNFGIQLGQALTNYSSNIVLTASNVLVTYSSNITLTASNAVITWSSNWALSIGLANTNFTLFASNALYALLPPPGSFSPWQDTAGAFGAAGSVYLTNGTPGNAQTVRLNAQSGGDWSGFDELGRAFIRNTEVNSGFDTWLLDVNSTKRMEIDDISDGKAGDTILQSSLGNTPVNPLMSDFVIAGTSQEVNTAFPLTFANQLWPATAIGSTTNFYDQEENSSTSTTVRDVVTVPANSMTNNGDTIIREMTVQLASGSGTREVQVLFGGASAFVDTGALTMTGGGFTHITVTITRINATTLAYGGSATITGTATPSTLLFGNTVSGFNSGSDWASASDFHVALTGASTGNLIMLTDTVHFSPASGWSVLP